MPQFGRLAFCNDVMDCNLLCVLSIPCPALPLRASTPAETGPSRKTSLIRSYGKQVIDLTELRVAARMLHTYITKNRYAKPHNITAKGCC